MTDEFLRACRLEREEIACELAMLEDGQITADTEHDRVTRIRKLRRVLPPGRVAGRAAGLSWCFGARAAGTAAPFLLVHQTDRGPDADQQKIVGLAASGTKPQFAPSGQPAC